MGCVTITESREKLLVQGVKTGISEESSPESFKTVSSNCASLEKSKAVKYVTSPGIESMRSNPAPGSVAQLFPLLLQLRRDMPGMLLLPSPAFQPCKRLCPLSWAEVCSSKCAFSACWQQPWRWHLCKVRSQPAEDNWISHSFPRDDLR